MTELIKVFRGDTEEVMTNFDPGTPDDVMWQMLVTPNIRGSLQRSNGVQVTWYSTVAAQGSYRFYVTDPDNFTARGLMQLPMPILSARITPRLSSSDSQTSPQYPRTFSHVLLWDGFNQGANQLLLSLDDQAAIYCAPRVSCWPGPDTLPSAAVEALVKGWISTHLAMSWNQLAADIGITARLHGAGSGRSSSFTDLVVRPGGKVTNTEHLSALIWGAGEVKGDWELSITRGQELFSTVHNEAELNDFLPGLQQVYGEGVMDEAALLILTNYHVTYFLKCSPDPADKRLWASPAVWWDQTDPPPRVCWLYALQQAEQLQQLKAALPRVTVPHIQAGPPVPQQQVDSGGETKLTSPPRASKRQHTAAQKAPEQDPELRSGSHTGKGSERHRLAAQLPALPAGGLHPHDQPALPDSWASEPVLGMDSLALSDTLLAFAQYGHILQGHYQGELVAVKMYDLRLFGAAEAYKNEKAAYGALAALQGSALPRLIATGILAHLCVPVVVTTIGGQPLQTRLSKAGLVPIGLRNPVEAALRKLHRAKVAHGDVRMSNILTVKKRVCLIDLGSAVVGASKSVMAEDMQRVADIFSHYHSNRAAYADF